MKCIKTHKLKNFQSQNPVFPYTINNFIRSITMTWVMLSK